MAFGGGGGGGFSFGSNNNSTSTGFGGFGGTNNNISGFGSTTTNATGFGSTATANPFSGGASGFGQNTGGFGSNNNTNSTSLFTKPNPFATSTTTANTGGNLFGNTGTANTGFGSTNTGFGASNTANAGFGANNNTASGFSFGQNKPSTFGSGTTGGGLFGQSGQGTTGGFGVASSSPFGGSGSGTALNQPVQPADGTAAISFAPTVEKDTPASSQSNAYQSISFMQPYQKYSFEELRLADYNAGRRYGNGTGQAGAFGSSTFGGGFGNANTGGFGNNTATTGGLFGGGQQSSSAGFGSNTSTTGFGGGGLFGNNNAAKPGGLFGQQSSSTTTGGLFGTSNNTTGSFGTNNTANGFGTNNNTTGGLFGNTNNQAKPGGLFGTTNTAPNNTGFSFGNNNTATPASTGGGLFGNNNQQASTGFGAGFGANNQTQAKPSLFSNATGGFDPASTQGQSTSLFGTSNNNNTSGGGLFGQSNTAGQPSGGLFGNTGSTGGGLFGQNNTNNDANKSAGGGLFGSNNTGGGLFGNNNTQQQQTQGGGLFGSNNATAGGFSFGNANANQQQKPSLFSNTSNNQTSGGLFGQTNNNNNPGSLFGNSMNNSQQQQQHNTQKTASALDVSAYGQNSIWTGLPTATAQSSTPLVTPLRAAQSLRDSKARPSPAAFKLPQARYMTPPRGRPGFGFTYSTYATPNSAASTPGTGGMYRNGLAGSFSRSSLGKSFSASNLRQQYANDGDSVMSPGAMTPKIANFSTGSMRRLKIDHTLRQDLFSPRLPALPPATSASSSAIPPSQAENAPVPIEAADKPMATDQPRQQPKKRVSFDRETTGGGLNGESGALVRTGEDEIPAEEPQFKVTRGRPTGKPTNGELEQVRGNELAVVPEDRVSDNETSMRLPTDVNPQPDPEPGNYWMKPTRSELQKMSRDKLKAFTGFQVGRRGCGYVTFTGPVDLTSINMDDVFDKIVEIRVRSITVYPESSSKPPMGKGLNVPSTLYIENSWPRARNKPSAATSGPVFDKHIQRLRRMAGTEFLNYDVKSGVWTFKVPHYTRYGLDYDEDDELGDSVVGLPSREDSPEALTLDDMDVETPDYSEPEDTFVGKQKTVPGGFGRSSLIPYDDDEDQGSEHSELPSDYEESDNDVDMVGSFPAPAQDATTEAATPAPALKASTRPWGTPGRPLLDLDGDWAEQLQRTISPRKQNRDALRNVQSKVLLDRAYEPIQPQRAANENKDFRTSIDVMNSLFGQHQQRVKEANSIQKLKQGQEADFEFPYAKRAKIFDPDANDMTRADAAWHDSFKPRWTSTGSLLIAQDDDQGRVVEVMKLASGNRDEDFKSITGSMIVKMVNEVPFITQASTPFSDLGNFETSVPGKDDRQYIVALKLAHLLFDNYVDEYAYGLSDAQRKQFDYRIRRDRLVDFLSALIEHDDSSCDNLHAIEPLAVVDLCKHDIGSAVQRLQKNKDYHLALLISQIEEADETFQEDISTQIKDWSEQNIISEMSDAVRTLYSILSGTTSVVKGKATGPVEDRASTFAISEHFKLSWLQAFGLTLWYGKAKNNTIEDSIIEFEAKVASGEENASPIHQNGNEDILWVLLKLYASRKGQMKRPLLPQAVAGSTLVIGMDTYHAFSLHHALVAKLGKTGEVAVDIETADKLASDLAFELSVGESSIHSVLLVLLHIEDTELRQESVKDLLKRFARHISDIEAFKELKVPTAWIWEAKAQYARSGHDSHTELQCLIEAKLYEAAHECFCRRVAPALIIDEDWDGLQNALSLFPKRVAVKDWPTGGGVYALFIEAMNGSAKDLDSLQFALVDMGRQKKSTGRTLCVEELREYVAIKEMSRVAAGMLSEVNAAAILPLPITSDARLRETKALAVEHYREIMAK